MLTFFKHAILKSRYNCIKVMLPARKGSYIVKGRYSRTYRIKPYEQSQERFIKVKKKDTPKIIDVGGPGKGLLPQKN